jgi:hypothetical protein
VANKDCSDASLIAFDGTIHTRFERALLTFKRGAWPAAAAIVTIGCGSTSIASPSEDASGTANDSATEAELAQMDGSVVPGLVDSSADGPGDTLGLDDTTAEAAHCGNSCPNAEPTVNDSCDFPHPCEYGGSPFVSCDRLYGCVSGRVALVPWQVPDAWACPAGLSPGCPASRATIGQANPCGGLSLQCVYADSECDCIQGNGVAIWTCSDADGGAPERCPVPRAMLGTPCSPLSAAGCQFVAPNLLETCSICGNQWATEILP